MKRLLIVTALLFALTPCVSASASTSVKSELLTSKSVSAGWSKYYIESQDTVSCPESNFRTPSGRTSVRAIFANRSSETLLLEQLTASGSPAKLYSTLVTQTLKCPKTGAKLDGQVTFQQIHSYNLTGIALPHRAFTLHAVVGGADVTGCVVYALKGKIVVAFAELSLLSLSEQQFKATFVKALKKITT
jgi:hypothetical protein